MKTKLLVLALCAASVMAFAQGKLTLQNDSGSPVVLNVVNGTIVPVFPVPTTGPLPSGISIEVGLYGGTSSGTMTLQFSELIDPPGGSGLPAGFIPMAHVTTAFPGGTADYFQLFIWDSAYATPQSSLAGGSYFGNDYIFTMTPGTSIGFPSILGGGGDGSTWAAVGNENAWGEIWIPEPTTFAVAGLGAAVLAIFRRHTKRGAYRH